MDSFQMACGLAGLLTVEVQGPGSPKMDRKMFAHPFALIGRDDRADLVLDHDKVSRRHAFLQVIDGRIFCIDLDSRTGTWIGESSSESGWVESGESLRIGPYRLRVSVDGVVPVSAKDGEPPSPLLARSSSASTGLPKVSLEFQSRTAGHSVWRMSQVMALVGGAPRCKVRLLDSNVSKLHCALVRTTLGLWVVDLLSREGITVNGLAVRSARIRPGDTLGLGHVTVRANFEDASSPPGPIPAAGFGVPGGGFSFGAGLPARAPNPGWSGPPGGSGAPSVPMPGFIGQAAPFEVSPGAAPPAVPGSSSSDPALAMLLGHFGQMQQQMLDQFQQSMFMMLQMFSGMHREQMGVMREELERLRELNEEITQIKAEIANRPAKSPIPAPPPLPPRRPANGQHPAAPDHEPAMSRAEASPPSPAPDDPPAAPPLEPSADVHDWLNDRLSAITSEQQNRWQKIMTMLRGEK